jgi:DNA-binding NarL/FixJ family response regulator
MTRLVIVADDPKVFLEVRDALGRTSGLLVVGMLDGRRSSALSIGELRPDVVLVDDMNDRALALARVGQVALAAPDAMCLLLTGVMDPVWLDDAFEAGADAVLSTEMQGIALGTTLREVVRGSVVHRPRRPARTVADPVYLLTVRESEILSMAAQGMTNGRIAGELWLTEQTVKFHLTNVYRKLGVSNRTQASHYAHLHGLVADAPTPTTLPGRAPAAVA